MNKKILIGSIIAVAILILVSFTGVVGYSSVKSSSAINSPLFNIRTSRAIEEESKDIACDYVGKGEAISISIPKQNNLTALTQKFIGIISKIDDKTFDKFIDRINNFIPNDIRINNLNTFMKIKNSQSKGYNLETNKDFTYFCNGSLISIWICEWTVGQFCLIEYLIRWLKDVIEFIIYFPVLVVTVFLDVIADILTIHFIGYCESW